MELVIDDTSTVGALTAFLGGIPAGTKIDLGGKLHWDGTRLVVKAEPKRRSKRSRAVKVEAD